MQLSLNVPRTPGTSSHTKNAGLSTDSFTLKPSVSVNTSVFTNGESRNGEKCHSFETVLYAVERMNTTNEGSLDVLPQVGNDPIRDL